MTESSPKRVLDGAEDLEQMSKTELIARIREQDNYVKQLESKKGRFERGDEEMDPSVEERLKQQQKEAARRENTLVHRLTNKEQELQDYVSQIQEMKQAQSQGAAQLRSMLLDPAVNLVFQRMGKEQDESQEKLKQTQNELSAWKFTPDSQTGKRLMTKCRMLLQENEELGKTIASGRTAKLEGEIALQKTLVSEMKNNQSELDEFLGDLEEDVEGMQTMIYVLQQQLRETKEQVTKLEEENEQLRAATRTTDNTVLGKISNNPKTDVQTRTSHPSQTDVLTPKPHTKIKDIEEEYNHRQHTKRDYSDRVEKEHSSQRKGDHSERVEEKEDIKHERTENEIEAMETDEDQHFEKAHHICEPAGDRDLSAKNRDRSPVLSRHLDHYREMSPYRDMSPVTDARSERNPPQEKDHYECPMKVKEELPEDSWSPRGSNGGLRTGENNSDEGVGKNMDVDSHKSLEFSPRIKREENVDMEELLQNGINRTSNDVEET